MGLKLIGCTDENGNPLPDVEIADRVHYLDADGKRIEPVLPPSQFIEGGTYRTPPPLKEEAKEEEPHALPGPCSLRRDTDFWPICFLSVALWAVVLFAAVAYMAVR